MRVTSESQESRQLILEVEAEPQEEAKAMDAAARRIAKRVKVPGFRPGKAPRGVIESYVGREYLLEEAAKEFAASAVPEAIKARDMQPFATPSVEFKGHAPLSFRVSVPLEPEVDPGAYRSVSVPRSTETVSGETVDKALEQLAYDQAPWEPSPGPVQLGHLVSIDVEATAEGKQIISQNGVQFLARTEPPVPVAGFAAQLVGMSPGEEKEFSLPFPEDYPREELRAKEAAFRVKVLEVKQRNPLPPGDELAKALDFEDLSALRGSLEGQLRSRAEAEARRELEERVVSEVVGGARVDFSPLLVEREVERLVREQNMRPNEKIIEELRPVATRRLLRSLVLDKVARAEGIQVADEEVTAEIERMSQGQRGGEVRRFFSSAAASQALREGLIRQKTVARLVDIATGEGAVQKGGT